MIKKLLTTLVISILIVSWFPTTAGFVPTTHAATIGTLTLSPNTKQIIVGQEVFIDLNIDTQGNQVTHAISNISFPSNILQFDSLIVGNFFDQTSYKSSGSGSLQISSIDIPPHVSSGTGLVARLRFVAKKADPIQPIAVIKLQHKTFTLDQSGSSSITDNYNQNILVGSNQTGVKVIVPPDITPPATPSHVAAQSISDTAVKVSWKNPSDLDFHHIKIYRSVNAGILGSLLTQTNIKKTQTYTDQHLTAGTKYYYTIFAIDRNANVSDPSIQIGITPTNPPPKPTTSTKTSPSSKTFTTTPATQIIRPKVDEVQENKLLGLPQITSKELDQQFTTGHNALADFWEVLYFGTVDQAKDSDDPDQDGLTNLQEFKLYTNPTLSDTDADQLSDGDELAQHTLPTNPDTDGDSLLDGVEIATYHTSPLKEDTDSDGYNDGVEIHANTDPLDPLSFPSDTDGDGIADIWSTKFALQYQEGQTPGTTDTDGDGLSDSLEYQYGTDPRNKDTDGDGYSDGQEVNLDNTDPLDTKSYRKLIRIAITNFRQTAKVIDSRPTFRGFAKPNDKLAIIKIDSQGHRTIVGSGTADTTGSFVIRAARTFSSKQKHTCIAVVLGNHDQVIASSAPVNFYVDTDIEIPSAPIISRVADQHLLPGFGLVVDTAHPKISGKIYAGSKLNITWQSLIFASSLIADTKEGDFSIYPPSPLELGEHTIHLSAVKDGVKSKEVILKLFIKKAHAAPPPQSAIEIIASASNREALQAIFSKPISAIMIGRYSLTLTYGLVTASVIGFLLIVIILLIFANMVRLHQNAIKYTTLSPTDHAHHLATTDLTLDTEHLTKPPSEKSPSETQDNEQDDDNKEKNNDDDHKIII